MMYNIQIGEKKKPLPVGDGGITPLHLLADHHQGPLGGGQHEQGLTLEQRDIKTKVWRFVLCTYLLHCNRGAQQKVTTDALARPTLTDDRVRIR